jgi:hypothetical protein
MVPNEVSAEVRRLADGLARVPIGELIEWPAICDLAGFDIQHKRRHLLYSAMETLQRECGAVLANERNVGYRRLTAEVSPGMIGSTARARIRGSAHRGAKAIERVMQKANDMTPEAIRMAHAERSALGLLGHLARDKRVKEAARTFDRPLSVTEAARHFLDALQPKPAG